MKATLLILTFVSFHVICFAQMDLAPNADPPDPKNVELTPFHPSSHAEVYYRRKKSGSAGLILEATEDTLVKVIDLLTGRLAVYLWIPENRIRRFSEFPESMYGIVSATRLATPPQGQLRIKTVWYVQGIDLTEPGSFARVKLSIMGDYPLRPSNLKTWFRFKVPGGDEVDPEIRARN